MTDNQIASLAMTGSDESRHDSVASVSIPKPARTFMRIWYAGDRFFNSFNLNCICGKARIEVTHREFDDHLVTNDGVHSVTHYLKGVPIHVYVSLFANHTNYRAICEIEGEDMEKAFAWCGNDPNTAECWYKSFGVRSLSVGDIIEVVKGDTSVFSVCCSQGYKELAYNDLETERAQEYSFPKGNRMFIADLHDVQIFSDRFNETNGDYTKWAIHIKETDEVKFYAECPENYREIITRSVNVWRRINW